MTQQKNQPYHMPTSVDEYKKDILQDDVIPNDIFSNKIITNQNQLEENINKNYL